MKEKNKQILDKIKGKILFIMVFIIFISGIIAVLNRDDSNKYIGQVSVLTNSQAIKIDGYKVGRQFKDDIKTFETKPLSEISDEFVSISEVQNASESENQVNTIDTKMEFIGNYVENSISYTIYDMNYNIVENFENISSLIVPIGKMDMCIVEVDVTWGREKNNVSMRYFFKIKLS